MTSSLAVEEATIRRRKTNSSLGIVAKAHTSGVMKQIMRISERPTITWPTTSKSSPKIGEMKSLTQ